MREKERGCKNTPLTKVLESQIRRLPGLFICSFFSVLLNFISELACAFFLQKCVHENKPWNFFPDFLRGMTLSVLLVVVFAKIKATCNQ